jgi:hypothetical protein
MNGVSAEFACTCIQEELAKMAKAFEVVSLATNTSIYANAVRAIKDLSITEEEVKYDFLGLRSAARKRLTPYYNEVQIFNHLTRFPSPKAAAEFLQFIEANTDEQLAQICHYTLETISLMAIPCKVVPELINLDGSNKVLGYVSRTPVEQWEDAPDKVSQLTFEIPVECVVKFFERDGIREEIKQAQSELNFFPYAMPLRLPNESMKYLECIDLDAFFRITSNLASRYSLGKDLPKILETQRKDKDSVQKELSKDYGKLFPWDLPQLTLPDLKCGDS